MRRHVRILLNAATVVSLVLCVATVALWVRSCWTITVATWSQRVEDRAVAHYVRCFGGRVTYQRTDYYYDPGVFRSHEVEARPLEVEERTLPLRVARRLGYPSAYPALAFTDKADWTDFNMTGGIRAEVSLWLPVILLAFVPTMAVGRWGCRRLRHRRRDRSLCPACGYDLRATPERCPECGTIPGR